MAKLFMKFSFFKTLFFFFYRVVFGQSRNPKSLHRSVSNIHANEGKYHKYPSFAHRSESDLSSDQTLVFNVEEALLRSSSLFPYFMLVAFEAGGLLRAFVLFALYPFLCLLSEEMGLKIMVLVCFFGIKEKSFRVGSAVLPKFFLEDVGLETFEMLKKGGKKVAVSNIPRVMIESFLKDYLEIDFVVGRELKSCGGYFLGVMEEKKRSKAALEEIIGTQSSEVIGITGLKKSLDYHLFSHCKEIYLVRKADKKSWQQVPKEAYPKPLVFHDGRLAFRPTLLDTLTMFMWVPFGFPFSIVRAALALTLPHKVSIPILAYTGLQLKLQLSGSQSHPLDHQTSISKKSKGRLYVCNHRTLLDPLYLASGLQKDLTAVTYSLSRVSEVLAPIRTVRLVRDRDRDGKMMEKLLSQGDLVVCPEGTTCREPYLLRFSPLFAEMSDDIVPVAMDCHVDMFYGTTAGGLKCLDPLFFLMNPCPIYTVKLLDAVSGLHSCQQHDESERSSFDVANHVQSEIGRALGFECTKLTRRDKYLILAGNEGIVKAKP